MKKYDISEIESFRKYFTINGFKEVTAELAGRKFSYFMLPQSLNPDLPDFVLRATGDSIDDCVFGISESVDPRYRQYAVFHEIVEFLEIGINTPNRCARALEKELELVPENIKADYIKMRTVFFRNLIKYCSGRTDFTENDIIEFRGSLSKLEELSK